MIINAIKKTFLNMSKKEKAVEAVGVLAFAGMMVYLIMNYASISDKIPNHFMFWAKPGTLDDKISLIYIPFITIVIYALLTALGSAPEKFKYPVKINRKNKEYYHGIASSLIRFFKIEIILIFSTVEISMINDALKNNATLPYWFLLVSSFVVFVTTIYFSYKLSSINPNSIKK